MTRELKFRAWDKKYECYVKVESIDFDFHGNIDSVWVDCEEHHHDHTVLNEDEVILEQDTGLKDKNGERICEGDIVNVIGIGIAQVIDSPSGEWMLYYRPEPDEINSGFASVIPKNKPSGLWKTNTTSYIEVVGNIHKNPELLGGRK